jgi:hypothetical protein
MLRRTFQNTKTDRTIKIAPRLPEIARKIGANIIGMPYGNLHKPGVIENPHKDS